MFVIGFAFMLYMHFLSRSFLWLFTYSALPACLEDISSKREVLQRNTSRSSLSFSLCFTWVGWRLVSRILLLFVRSLSVSTVYCLLSPLDTLHLSPDPHFAGLNFLFQYPCLCPVSPKRSLCVQFVFLSATRLCPSISFQDPALPLHPALSSFISPFHTYSRIRLSLRIRRILQPTVSPLHQPQNSSNYLLSWS